MVKFWKMIGMAAVCGLSPGTMQANADSLMVIDHSFEYARDSLDNGILGTGIGAEYQKNIGGWDYSRGSLLGLLPPHMGSFKSDIATDGNNVASIHALAGVAGHGTIKQTLNHQFEANTRYTLSVDVGKSSLAEAIASGPGIAITSSTQGVVASSLTHSLLRILDLNICFDRWELTFMTGGDAPKGDIGIALFSGDLVNVAEGVSFDNVSMSSTAVPTPSAAAAGLTCLTLLVARRRSRHQAETLV